MKINKYCLGLITVLLLAGCKKENQIEEIIRPVKILDLSQQKTNYEISFPTIAIPYNETILAFKVAGPIEDIFVEQGDKVKKGQKLGILDKRDYLINLEVYKKKYEAAKAAADNMIAQYKRAKIMYDGKAMSAKNFDIIEAQYKASLATLKTAEEGVKNAENRLEDIYLKAPYDGYIGKRILDKGSVVNAGTPVLSIISKGKPKLSINVAGKDINNIKNASSYLAVIEEKEYELKLSDISKKTDLLKLTYPVTFEFTDDVENILVGTTGYIKVQLSKEVSDDIFIPLSSLFEKNGTKVYIYENGIVKSKDIEIGELYSNGNVKVIRGLSKDDKVITAGVNTISEGEKVKILEESSDTNIGGVL